ncbi:MAG: hypothetical protein IKH28_08410 [Lachnospiraceae bacterium]|nr:hypothetical protein [Lachnospiraceae bacterium]
MAKKVLRNIVLTIIFIAILCFGLFWLDRIFLLKDTGGVQLRFSSLKRDSVDTVFVGTSHLFCGIDPDILYEEYGINSFMLATSGQTLPMTYYATMEAIQYQHPKRIIFEVCYVANGLITISNEMSHYFFDGMPNCEAKKLALEELVAKEDRIYFYLPFGIYHTRWKELEKKDFLNNEVSERGGVHFDRTYNMTSDIPLVHPMETEEMPEGMEEWLEKIVALCKENQVELILCVAPYNSQYEYDEYTIEDLKRSERVFNTVGDFAAERGLEWHNLFYELDEIGLDNATDWMDTQHLNQNGQAKFTRYMAEQGYVR